MEGKDSSRVVSLAFFKKNRKKLKKVVLIGGAFDIMHVGHLSHLRRAKSLGDTLVVHVTSDARVREKKGNGRPIFNEKQRALFVASLRAVDYVFIYNGRHYDTEVLAAIQPDIVLFNQEAYSKEVAQRVKNIQGFKGKIVVSKERKATSTSEVLGIIQSQEPEWSIPSSIDKVR